MLHHLPPVHCWLGCILRLRLRLLAFLLLLLLLAW
jgi:hypothetical protein